MTETLYQFGRELCTHRAFTEDPECAHTLIQNMEGDHQCGEKKTFTTFSGTDVCVQAEKAALLVVVVVTCQLHWRSVLNYIVSCVLFPVSLP